MLDVLIIGAGQAGLSVAYFLKRYTSNYLLLDNRESPGGAWLKTWDSLRLFSPTQFSSLSGWPMPQSEEAYPTKDEFIEYLTLYEQRYKFPIERPVSVEAVNKTASGFEVLSSSGQAYQSKMVVCATGTASGPLIPSYPNAKTFEGQQIHSVDYKTPADFTNQRVLVVGAGNSGAQVFSDLVLNGVEAKWTSLHEPSYLPDDIDGRYLFESSTHRYLASLKGEKLENKYGLNQIVMVEPVKQARDQGLLEFTNGPFEFEQNGVLWTSTLHRESFDAVIWCTGFRAELPYLASLGVPIDKSHKTKLTKSLEVDGLWLVGFGSWTGYASATIYGVGKTCKQTALEIKERL